MMPTDGMNPEAEIVSRPIARSDQFTDSETNSIIHGIGRLVLPDDTVLEAHQQEAFYDIVDYFASGGKECYAQMPTGTGKTVLFVELIKRQSEAAAEIGEKSRSLVLVPTVDLVDQTVGSVDEKSGKKRGFMGFAPELDTRPLHGKMSRKNRARNIAEGDVLVTTYDTFRGLISTFTEAEVKTDEEWQADKTRYQVAREESLEARDSAELERAAFVESAYQEQEVTNAGTRASELLELHGEEGDATLSGAEIKRLKSILEVADADPEILDDKQKLTQVRKRMRKNLPPAAVKELVRRRELATAKRKAQWKLLKKSDIAGVDEQDVEDNKEVKKLQEAIVPLSEVEKFLVSFVWRHRNNKPPKNADITGGRDRETLAKFRDEIDTNNFRAQHMAGLIRGIDDMVLIRQAVSEFDIMICDEAHRSIGTQTWDAVTEYARRKEIAILGTTATDQYHKRTLEDYFDAKVHELTKEEAIARGIVNPMALFAYNTGLNFGGIGLDASGDYDRMTLKELRNNEQRNEIGIGLAKVLSELGYRGIISSIPGGGAAHAIYLAERLNEEEILDPETGGLRKLRAASVIGDPNKDERQENYEAFERGELDWITFVDVIREGWDSDTAKALINMRLTRSPLLATQRLGRVGRTHPGAPVSIAIDLFDGLQSTEEFTSIPPVLTGDVFGLDEMEQGHLIGELPEGSQSAVEILKRLMPEPTVASSYSRYVKTLENALWVNGSGIGFSEAGHAGGKHWQTFEALQNMLSGFLPKEILLDAVQGDEPTVKTASGRKGIKLMPLFNVEDVLALHTDRPEVNPLKLFVDDAGEKWITPEGCLKMLSKKYPRLETEDIIDAIRQTEAVNGEEFAKIVARVKIRFGTANDQIRGLTHMYNLNEVIDRLVPHLQTTYTL